MRGSAVTSRPGSLICPLCEASRLCPSAQDSTTCQSCGTRLRGAMLETLRGISTLPDAAGSHACECGHPKMRHLPDGTYHCPACGSEVLSFDVPSSLSKPDAHGEAYRAGRMDGRFGERSGFVDNPNLAK
jgi:ribosomal protein L37AE/L43A